MKKFKHLKKALLATVLVLTCAFSPIYEAQAAYKSIDVNSNKVVTLPSSSCNCTAAMASSKNYLYVVKKNKGSDETSWNIVRVSKKKTNGKHEIKTMTNAKGVKYNLGHANSMFIKDHCMYILTLNNNNGGLNSIVKLTYKDSTAQITKAETFLESEELNAYTAMANIDVSTDSIHVYLQSRDTNNLYISDATITSKKVTADQHVKVNSTTTISGILNNDKHTQGIGYFNNTLYIPIYDSTDKGASYVYKYGSSNTIKRYYDSTCSKFEIESVVVDESGVYFDTNGEKNKKNGGGQKDAIYVR